MFKDDHKMPHYCREEFETGLRYLELLTNLADAKKNGIPEVASGYETLSLKEAQGRIKEYRQEFDHAVDAQTHHLTGKTGHELRLLSRGRAHDILASLMDTGFARKDSGAPETGRY